MLSSLRAKVGVTYLVLVALTALIALFAAQRLVRLTRTVETVLRDDVGAVVALQNLVRELDRQDDALRTLAVANPDESAADSARAAFARAAGQFDAWRAEAEGRLVDASDLRALDTLDAAYTYYQRAAAVVVRRSGQPGYSDDAPREAARRSAYVRAETMRLLDRRARAVDDARRAAEADARRSATLVLVAAFGAFGVGLVLSFVFARSVVAPVEQLTRSVRQIGQGRMRQTVEIRTNDELAVLGREFNRMTERLDAYEAMNVQQLVAEKRTSEELVETMPSPLIVTDDAGNVVLLNDAARALAARHAASVPADDGPTLPVEAVFPDETLRASLLPHPDRAPNALVEVEQGGDVRVFRARHRRIDEAGLTVALLEDVTHFARLDRMKSDFLAAVSHELRTPLMSLGLAADLLLAGAPAPEQADLLATIKDDHARLKRLVDGLIALARMESAPPPAVAAPVDLAAVVRDALTPLRLPFREKTVALDVHLPDDLPVVTGDAEHLGWVVTNLAANALRHTPPGGTVAVSVLADDARTVRLAVSDTGEGIPPDQLDAVFGAFVQLKDRNTATPGSLGLGLALAKRIVDAHGGRIRAESAVGQGSTFVVDLPAAAP